MLYKKVVSLDSLSVTPVTFKVETNVNRPVHQNAVVMYRLLDANKNLIVGGHDATGKVVTIASFQGMTEAIPDGTTHLSTIVSHGVSYNRPNFSGLTDYVSVSLDDYTAANAGNIPVYLEVTVNRWGQ